MPIVFFIVVFVLTILLQRWLHAHIQGSALALTGNRGCAVRLLYYLLLPGIALHELSHYVAAKLLFVRTNGITIGVGRTKKRQVSLGSVNVAKSDPVRESLIGVAPFVVGVGAIWLITGFGFGLWPHDGLTFEEMLRRVAQYAHDWTTWLDVYLIFAVSTAMIPSDSDRAPWGPVIGVFGMMVVVLFVLGWMPRVPVEWVNLARRLLDALTFALGIAVVVNGAIAILLWIFERMVEKISGKRVDYGVRRK